MSNKKKWQCPNCTNITMRFNNANNRGRKDDTPTRGRFEPVIATETGDSDARPTATDASSSQRPIPYNTAGVVTSAPDTSGVAPASTSSSLTQELSDFKAELKNILNSRISQQEQDLRSILDTWMTQQEETLKSIKPAILEIQQTNAKIEASISFLSDKYDEIMKKVEILETNRRSDKEYITLLEDRVEDLQRAERKTCMELKNVPTVPNETPDKLIDLSLNLAKTTGLSLCKDDIKDIFRVQGKKENGKPIIIELSTTFKKNALLKATRAYNKENKDSKLNASHLGIKDSTVPVYISEHLTPKSNRLYFLARDLIKSKAFKFAWTSFGKVYVRKDESSQHIQIKTEQQVMDLRNTKD